MTMCHRFEYHPNGKTMAFIRSEREVPTYFNPIHISIAPRYENWLKVEMCKKWLIPYRLRLYRAQSSSSSRLFGEFSGVRPACMIFGSNPDTLACINILDVIGQSFFSSSRSPDTVGESFCRFLPATPPISWFHLPNDPMLLRLLC